MRPRWPLAAAVAAVVVVLALGLWQVFHLCCMPPARAAGGAARKVPGEGDRVIVEVLNATDVTGLARGATRQLRDAGLDVVYFGSDTSRALDSTEVLVRRGDAAAGERVRQALGTGRVRTAPDPARLVDITVRLGADFAVLGRDP